MIGIEIFAGAGGMATGAKLAGVDVRLAVELDPYAAQTYINNHKETTVIVDDIRNVKKFDFKRNENPVVLFGGPPCQGYSYSNRKTRNSDNPKNWLFKEFIRCVEMISPDWVVIENVPGLKRMEGGYFIKILCNDLRELGYTPNMKILNAADYGVPQSRERLFIVASKQGIAFEFPEGAFKEKPVTVREALSDLPSLNNGDKFDKLNYKRKSKSPYAKEMRGQKRLVTQNYVTKNSDIILERYKYIREGNNWKDIPLDLMKNYKEPSRCHSNIYRRLSNDSPSVIITNYRKSMIVHPDQNRGLSVREAARLQSFPDSYNFFGSLSEMQQQVGNAVPPFLAREVFKEIIKTNNNI